MYILWGEGASCCYLSWRNGCRKMLANYCIGELKPIVGEDQFKSAHLEYEDAAQEDFYMVVKQRVEAYFKKRKVWFDIHLR